MSRPKPTILLEAINKQTYKAEQVLEASAIYSVFYKDTPINLRTLHTLVVILVQNTKKFHLVILDMPLI